MSAVYSAIEFAEEDLPKRKTVEDVAQLVHDVAETVENVVDQYRDVEKAYGGQGENAKRADDLEGWKDELEQFEPEPEEPDDADEVALTEDVDAAEAEALEAAREAAQELLNGCPL
jgi:hypothetical protein